jgi:hypothetical protein
LSKELSWIHSFDKHIRALYCSSTYTYYKRDVDLFVHFMHEHHMHLESLVEDHIVTYIVYLMLWHSGSSAMKRKMVALRLFFEFMHRYYVDVSHIIYLLEHIKNAVIDRMFIHIQSTITALSAYDLQCYVLVMMYISMNWNVKRLVDCSFEHISFSHGMICIDHPRYRTSCSESLGYMYDLYIKKVFDSFSCKKSYVCMPHLEESLSFHTHDKQALLYFHRCIKKGARALYDQMVGNVFCGVKKSFSSCSSDDDEYGDMYRKMHPRS